MKSLSNGLSVSFVRVFCLRAMLLFGFLLVMLAGAQSARAATPCCAIKSIDLKTGIVAATENATGREFTFKVTNATLLHSLKVGQGIYANFATKQVSVDGVAPCCGILSLATSTSGTAQLGSKAKPLGPCCAITAINAKTGIVTASENATGRTFSFKVTGTDLLNSLKVGQGIYANFATKQVSVDGVAPCCSVQ